MTPRQEAIRTRLAHHEAGHAVVAVVMGLPFEEVWVGVPGQRGWTLGYLRRDDDDAIALSCDRTKAFVLAEESLAGFAAEEILRGKVDRARVRRSGDWSTAVWNVRHALDGDRRLLVTEADEQRADIRQEVYLSYDLAQMTVQTFWPAVQRVARALMDADGEPLDQRTVERLIEETQ